MMETNSGGPYNIGQAARRSSVSAKMVRHYESLGLLPKVGRTESGYRQYTDKEVHTLRFIKRARDLGFSMAEIAELLKLWQNKRRSSESVKRIATTHIAQLDQRVQDLQSMQRTLQHLANCCHGDQRPDCPILDQLADGGHEANGRVRTRTSEAACSAAPARATGGWQRRT